MRVFSLVLAALPLAVFSAEETPALRGHRELTHGHNWNGNTAFFPGWATSGRDGAVPINSCFTYNPNAGWGQNFQQCDGKAAADQFCREKHYGWATSFGVVPLTPHHAGGYRAVVIGSNHLELDGSHPNQHILNDVTCQR